MEKLYSTSNLYDLTNRITLHVRALNLPLHLYRCSFALFLQLPALLLSTSDSPPSQNCNSNGFQQSLSYSSCYFSHTEPAKFTDKDHDNYIDDFFTAMRTYQVEFDAESPIAKLPACFSREYLNVVDPFVILRDPNLNEFEVHVTRKSNKLYFDKGWSDLKNVYDLSFGAWVTFGYVNPKFFTIRLTARWGVEVKYPMHSPQLRHLPDKNGIDNSYLLGDPQPSLNVYVPCRSFVRTFMKQITKHDMHSGVLTLPWGDFGEHVFTSGCTDLVLVDCLGERYECKVAPGVDVAGQHIYKVSGGWVDLCTVHGVVEGTRVGFCVAHPASSHVMYVTAYPQMGIQTILSYPLSDGSEVPLYVSQHYFLA